MARLLWALLLLPWVVALVLVRRHHHLDGGTVGILVAVSLGLPTLWLTWAAYRGPRRSEASVSGLSLAQVADQLAIAVGAQWEAEAAMRRLNDPYPLPVSWTAADASLTDSWDSLVKLATSGAGWPPPPPAGTWAAGPDDLAGEGGELADVLARVPTGRLVVLGEPGAGKTMLMVRLVLDLLARRASGGPVPILASVASWNPADQDLRDWLGAQLLIDHPALAAPPPAGRTESTQAAALLASGLILPVLDGLDEIPEEVRGPAISRINDALRPGEQVVVTCRTQQYRDAVRPQGGVEVTLRAAAAVQLRPLDADAVRGYLCDDAAGPVARARWDPVLAVLGTEAPAGQALSTPLMVGLARAIYNPRPGELAGTLRDPAELCSPALADRTAVESLLFDAFIPAAYRHDPAGRWKAQDAEKWLVFLARHLEYTIGSPDLAWWQLPLAVPGFALVAAGVVAGVVVGAVVGVVVGALAGGSSAGVVAGLTFGVVVGLVVGAVMAARRGRHETSPRDPLATTKPPQRRGSGSWPGPRSGSRSRSWPGLWPGRGVAGPWSGSWSASGPVRWTTGRGRSSRPQFRCKSQGRACRGSQNWNCSRSSGRGRGRVRDRGGRGRGRGRGVELLRSESWPGSCWGPRSAAFSALRLTASPSYEIARIWLTLRHRLPWQFMGFLADAHRRGVLRQAGAVYQFRHIELQHRLANRAAPARIGSYFDVQDVSGDTYQVTLVKVIDPAQGADQFTTPDSGKRFVAAVFRIKALRGSPQDEDANNDAVIVGSNGQSYTADFSDIAGYTNFDNGTIHVAQGDTETGSVTFQVPEGVKAARVQWTPGAFGSAVQWNVRS